MHTTTIKVLLRVFVVELQTRIPEKEALIVKFRSHTKNIDKGCKHNIECNYDATGDSDVWDQQGDKTQEESRRYNSNTEIEMFHEHEKLYFILLIFILSKEKLQARQYKQE